VEVLSRFAWVYGDARFRQLLELLLDKADRRYQPESVWMAYKGFDFCQKKEPSPTLTLMVERIRQRVRRGP